VKEELLHILRCSLSDFYSTFLPKAIFLRFKNFENYLETCAILNAKSGRCPSDCKFCAQSSVSTAKIKVYPLMKEEELVERALKAFEAGVNRFSFVTSGISPTREEVKTIGKAVENVVSRTKGAQVCVSLGVIGKRELEFLKGCGISRYHHNLETSKEFYPRITSTQSWHERLRTVERAKEAGLSVCCGGVFGMGEGPEDIVSLAVTLANLEVDSVPVNFLHPIKGTPLEGANFLTPVKALRILTLLRIAMPKAQVRLCGGREYNLKNLQPLALLVADSLMVGDYLTTPGRALKEDASMIKELGLSSTLEV
jgi:biotin synthase